MWQSTNRRMLEIANLKEFYQVIVYPGFGGRIFDNYSIRRLVQIQEILWTEVAEFPRHKINSEKFIALID